MRRAPDYAWIYSGAWTCSGAAAAIVLLLLCNASYAQTGPVVARATNVNGRNLLYSEGTAPVALTAGYILNTGDRIDTRGGGRVVIELSDGSMVVVQPESVIILKDFHQASSLRELFEIILGVVRVKINHFGGRPNPYRMNSPTASIAVRGTEFSIEVAQQGDTQVVVYEGAVEVSSLQDPDRKTLIEAGRGVLVQAGQDFHFIGRNDGGPGRMDQDRDHRPQVAVANAGGPAPAQPQAQPQPQSAGANAGAAHTDGHGPPAQGPSPHMERDDSPRAIASANDRYVAGLSDIAQVPFLFRYNAFAERHLDSLENPAYATEFTSGEGRIFVLPSVRGLRGFEAYEAAFGPGGTLPGDYRISPQFSIFTPIPGTAFTVGSSAAASRMGTGGTSTDAFYSGSLAVARRVGKGSFGLEVEALKGDGSVTVDGSESSSRIRQNRLTGGFSTDLTKTAKLGVFYRYALLSGSDASHAYGMEGLRLNLTGMSGHSSEIGLRLRGAISQRLSYGVAGAWLGVSLRDGLLRAGLEDSQQRDRAQRASLGFGLGYALTRRTVVSLDFAGGAAHSAATQTEDSLGSVLQNGDANRHFVSVHGAVQTDVTRHLFVSASLMNVWERHHLNVDVFPDRLGNCVTVQDSFLPFTTAATPVGSRFSDYGAGWRFTPNFFVQYLYSTDYGVSPSSHTLMLRYTFRLRGE